MTTNTATLVKSDLPKFNGVAHLYRLNPPMPGYDEGETHEYVVVSAADRFCTETYIFAADVKGEIAHWRELGGLKGTLDHTEALRDVGYEVA